MSGDPCPSFRLKHPGIGSGPIPPDNPRERPCSPIATTSLSAHDLDRRPSLTNTIPKTASIGDLELYQLPADNFWSNLPSPNHRRVTCLQRRSRSVSSIPSSLPSA